MTNGMPKVNQIAQAGFARVDGDNVGFDRDGADYDGQEELLRWRTRLLGSSCIVDRWTLDGCKYLRGARL